jgi:hypothetical protein
MRGFSATGQKSRIHGGLYFGTSQGSRCSNNRHVSVSFPLSAARLDIEQICRLRNIAGTLAAGPDRGFEIIGDHTGVLRVG